MKNDLKTNNWIFFWNYIHKINEQRELMIIGIS